MDKIQKYGTIGIVYHLATSWTFFGVTWLLTHKSNSGDRIVNYLNLQNKIPKGASSFVIAGIIYKAVMPFRIAFTLLSIPFVVKALNIDVELP